MGCAAILFPLFVLPSSSLRISTIIYGYTLLENVFFARTGFCHLYHLIGYARTNIRSLLLRFLTLSHMCNRPATEKKIEKGIHCYKRVCKCFCACARVFACTAECSRLQMRFKCCCTTRPLSLSLHTCLKVSTFVRYFFVRL